MNKTYEIEQLKVKTESRIAQTKAFIEGWENVTFPTKKDGAPFKNMAQNFSGADYRKADYSLQDGEYRLSVCVRYQSVSNAGYSGQKYDKYDTDYIDCYQLVKYLKDDEMKTKTENYMPKQTMLEQVYKYDLDDCKKAVAQRIEKLKKQLAVYEKQLKVIESAYNAFATACQKAITELAENTMREENSILYYDILNLLKGWY